MTHPRRTAFSVIASIGLACSLPLIAGAIRGQAAPADAKTTQKFSASAIQIEPVDASNVPLPPEFRVAVYENLIAQIEKTGKFQHVYRSGDKNAASAPDLVTLRTIAQSFTKGSQKKREVTTVTGATSLTLKLEITNRTGQTLVDRNVRGGVHFFGENLAATHDFSKKVAAIIQETF